MEKNRKTKKTRADSGAELPEIYRRLNNELAQVFNEHGTEELQVDGELKELLDRREAAANAIIYEYMTEKGYTYDNDHMTWSKQEGCTI